MLSGNKGHRKSTLGRFHALSGCSLFNSSRAPKIVCLYIFTRGRTTRQMESIFAQFLNLLLEQKWTATSSQIPRAHANL